MGFPETHVLFPGKLGGTICKWLVQPGQKVDEGQPLAECSCETDGSFQSVVVLKSPYDGTLLEHLVPVGGSVSRPQQGVPHGEDKTQFVARMDYCKHGQVFGTLCGICFRQVTEKDGETTKPVSKHHKPVNVSGQKLHVNQEEAESHNERTITRLFHRKRLSLVLDLDHTLLHATNDARAPSYAQSKGVDDFHRFSVTDSSSSKFKRPHQKRTPREIQLFCRLRPGLADWLQEMHSMYELYIYTAGTRKYAEAIAKIIDPNSDLFNARILSRTDVPELGHSIKSLKQFFPIDDTMVVVIDDREDVWAGCKNLITIEPYHFWRNLSDVNNSSGKVHNTQPETESTQNDNDKAKMDRGLRRVRDLLRWVHKRFFNTDGKHRQVTLDQQLVGDGRDVKQLLDTLRSRVFGNKKIKFLLDVPSKSVKKMSKALGATICDTFEDNPTHIISASPQSPTAEKGKSTGLWVVHPDWVSACWQHWIHEPEVKFSVFGVSKECVPASNPPPTVDDDQFMEIQDPNEAEEFDEFGYPISKPSDEAASPLKKRKVDAVTQGNDEEEDDDEDEDDDEMARILEQNLQEAME